MEFMERTRLLGHKNKLFKLRPAAAIFGLALSLLSYEGLAQTQPTCSVKTINQWGSGSQMELTVANASNTAIDDWHVELTYSNGKIYNSWNANRAGQNPAQFNAPSWNRFIQGNSNIKIGYLAQHNAGFETPTITACYAGVLVSDDDSDGINNNQDDCPNTDLNASVNAQGCAANQLDADNDGITNNADACPSTPMGESVNSSGCANSQLDDDADSIFNNADICPNTTGTNQLDANGCSWEQRDADSDSILNSADLCPNTAAGLAVNADGCADSQLDSDNDGVLNGTDTCPGTPAGATVNTAGCAQSQIDDDVDGIFNDADTCPATPAGSSVDTTGCSDSQIDDDADGVFNNADICPNTASTNQLDANGCSWEQRDEDGDSILNNADLCPNSAAGLAVNSDGCADGQLDSDNDGVLNGTDICPSTPVGASVNATGCAQSQIDDDADGVFNDADTCPSTPEGSSVNNTGCADSQIDDDADGVFNNADICPNTTSTNQLDANGCSWEQRDEDGDSILNTADLCPNTAAGLAVNSDGCADSQLDSDNDGVLNGTDICPSTPVGASVNATGCAQSQIDDDADGVFNDADTCPSTPEGSSVNNTGCADSQIDDDADGVFNNADICPNTTSTNQLDANGCSWEQRDEDGDSILNTTDLCPDTAAGLAVNSDGCADSQLDSDNDGVLNGSDTCPSTSIGASVNTAGCAQNQIDDDADGIFNDADTCPSTPTGESVNTTGCSDSQIDDDGDGIFNNADICPNTANTNQMDANGCSWEQLDEDGDLILNSADLCPNTAAGLEVNSDGCANSQLDSDNDGVLNGTDTCPGTPAGATVNTAGCAQSQIDDDADGVFNDADTCPTTPAGSSVNTIGCANSQIDDDADGVFNNADICPNTINTNQLDANGCSWEQRDEDGDSILNSADLCPNSPLGQPTDQQGCADEQRDADQDGIRDALDLCPNSSSNNVTHFGCVIGEDPDGDRIPNEFDLCPNSMGLVELHGCKPQFGDFDADDIPDLVDACPYSIHPNAAKPIGAELYPDQHFIVDETGCSSYDNEVIWDEMNPSELNGQSLCSKYFPFSDHNSAFQAGILEGCTEQQLGDDDHDGIINGLDVCPDEIGTKLFNGCLDPNFTGDIYDYDNDGVPNDKDHCPFTQAIESELGHLIGPNGCLTTSKDKPHFQFEDIDQDGVFGDEDYCPSTPLGHMVDNNGCSAIQQYNKLDDDQDGVLNQWDLCPNSFGGSTPESLSAFGCNIEDEYFGNLNTNPSSTPVQIVDGIPSHMDACPAEAGLLINNGCPTQFTTLRNDVDAWQLGGNFDDQDNDGIPDFDDNCAFTRMLMPASGGNSGFMMQQHGCLLSDFKDDDGDGVINGKDRCPMSKNADYLDAQGCNDWDRLDSDGDQLINGEDLCPQTFGFWQSNGCSDNSLDGDNDGVPNELDRCPSSPRNQYGPLGPIDHREFDENNNRNPNFGCSIEKEMRDDDADNVPNIDDRCPKTPFGDQVWPTSGSNNDRAGCSFSQSDLSPPSEQCFETPDMLNPGECSEPWGDDDGDNIPNEIDKCADTPHGTPMDVSQDREGCSLPLKNSIHLLQIAEPSPELPPESQEHEIDLIALTPIGENSNLIPYQPRQAEIGVFADQQWVDIFYDVDLLRIHVQPNQRLRTIRIPVRIQFIEQNLFTNWFEIVISPQGDVSIDGFENLIINDPQLLNQTGITLHSAFMQLAQFAPQSFGGDPTVQLFKQFWDSQRSGFNSFFGLTPPYSCGNETELFKFPVVCDRPETDIVWLDDFATRSEMDRYRLTAIVNRIDLHKNNWEDCGEQRLVFALQDNMNSRLFINMEARINNPTPGDLHGCEPSIIFWRDIANMPDTQKAQRIQEFLMGSPFDDYAVLSPEYFSEQTGQIRTNQFVGGDWLLREHKLEQDCLINGCALYAKTVSVKENPFGELFNPDLPFMNSPFSFAAMQFQDEFLNSIDDLANENLGDIKLTTPPQFNNNQSHAGGPAIQENDYRMHFGGNDFSQFGNDLMFSLQGKYNADGSPLEIDQLLARATALSCAGCHNPEELGLTQPNSIGSLKLPNGSMINSWPRSHDFVHINEEGELSPALMDVFLPIRKAGFEEILNQF